MEFNLKLHQYVDWKVHDIVKIKGKFGYRVKLIYPDGSEIKQQKSGFSSKKIAQEARDKTIGELYSGNYVVYANVKLKDFLIYWTENVMKPKIKVNTYNSYKNVVYRHIIPSIGNISITDLTMAHVQKLYKEEAIFSESVVRLVKTVMNVSMQYAVAKKMITVNPALNVDLPKSVKKKKYHTRAIDTQKTLTMEQVHILLQASRGSRIHMQVLFNVLMGLRRCEINGVKYSDVDYINRTLKVQRQLGTLPNTSIEEFAPKTYGKQEIELKTPSSYRELRIPDCVFEAILEERKIYEKNRRRRTTTFQDLNYICCSTYGRPRSKDYHWPHFKKLLSDNNLPNIRWHDLRSTFCTLLLKENFNPKAVSRMMGHAKEIITIDVYGDTKQIIEDCLNELQPFINEVIPYSGLKKVKDFSKIAEAIRLDELVEGYI